MARNDPHPVKCTPKRKRALYGLIWAMCGTVVYTVIYGSINRYAGISGTDTPQERGQAAGRGIVSNYP